MTKYRLNFSYDFFLTIEAYTYQSARRAADKMARAYNYLPDDVEVEETE